MPHPQRRIRRVRNPKHQWPGGRRAALVGDGAGQLRRPAVDLQLGERQSRLLGTSSGRLGERVDEEVALAELQGPGLLRRQLEHKQLPAPAGEQGRLLRPGHGLPEGQGEALAVPGGRQQRLRLVDGFLPGGGVRGQPGQGPVARRGRGGRLRLARVEQGERVEELADQRRAFLVGRAAGNEVVGPRADDVEAMRREPGVVVGRQLDAGKTTQLEGSCRFLARRDLGGAGVEEGGGVGGLARVALLAGDGNRDRLAARRRGRGALERLRPLAAEARQRDDLRRPGEAALKPQSRDVNSVHSTGCDAGGGFVPVSRGGSSFPVGRDTAGGPPGAGPVAGPAAISSGE